MTVDKNSVLAVFDGDKLVEIGTKGTGKVLIPLDKLPVSGSTVDASTFQVAFTDGTNFSDKVGVPTFTVPETTTTSTTSTTINPATSSTSTTTSTTSSTTVKPETTSTTTTTTINPTTTTTSTTSSTTVQPETTSTTTKK